MGYNEMESVLSVDVSSAIPRDYHDTSSARCEFRTMYGEVKQT